MTWGLYVGQPLWLLAAALVIPAWILGRRSLGLYVLLRQIQYAREAEKTYLYHGYAYREPSFYDYKKNFYGLEYFDWKGSWLPYAKTPPANAG